MDLMARRRAIMGMPSGKDYTVSGNVVSVSNALAKNAKSLIVSFLPKQSGSGDPSPSNVRPISGYNDIGAVRYGKNLLSQADYISIEQGTSYTNGTFSSTNASVYSGTIVRLYNGNTTVQTIVASNATEGARGAIPVTFNSSWNKMFVGYRTQGTYNVGAYYSKPSLPDGNYIVSFLVIKHESGNYSFSDIQLELGNTATSYEPYISPVTANVHSGTTIFGGTVDLVSGECVVDRVFETITGNSNWYSFSTGTGNSSAVVQLAHWDNVKYTSGNASYNGAIGSSGREAQNYWTNARQNEVPNEGDMAFAYSSGGQLRVHRTDVANITDLASFKSAFVDLQICYPLATPITYHLTPSQLAMLKGNNTVYSNEGSISLTYVGK